MNILVFNNDLNVTTEFEFSLDITTFTSHNIHQSVGIEIKKTYQCLEPIEDTLSQLKLSTKLNRRLQTSDFTTQNSVFYLRYDVM